jgi:hypothetical protein
MFDMFVGPRPTSPGRVTRIIDEGRVLCPIQGRDIDVRTCQGCAYLALTRPATRRRPAEIVCRPSARAIRHAQAPF